MFTARYTPLPSLEGESVSVRDPAKYYQNNLAGTLNLFDAMRAHNVNKLVWFETSSDVREVIRRERQLKNWRRAWKHSAPPAGGGYHHRFAT